MTEINQGQIRGEKGTGFEKRGDRGPFECGNCTFFDKGYCTQETMKKLSQQPKNKEGYPEVKSVDCCEYIARRPKVW